MNFSLSLRRTRVFRGALKYISQAEGFGGWVHCAGVTTPWESHLGSEEYEPNARAKELNKAYKIIVEEQSFIYGRDAHVQPVENVYREVVPDKPIEVTVITH